MTTNYVHCAISNVSLDNQKCVLFVLKKQSNSSKIFGSPIPATYNETKGVFDVNEIDIDSSFNEVLSALKVRYTKTEHESLLIKNIDNKHFTLLPVLETVYYSIAELNLYEYSKTYIDTIKEELKTLAESKSLYIKMLVTFKEATIGKETAIPEGMKVIDHPDVLKAAEDYDNFVGEDTFERAVALLEACKKQGEPINIWIAEPIDQVSINTLLNDKNRTIHDAASTYLMRYSFSIFVNSVIPNKSFLKNPIHQGTSVQNHIDFHQAIIDGLKEINEMD